jgi:hypothetical protein
MELDGKQDRETMKLKRKQCAMKGYKMWSYGQKKFLLKKLISGY